MIRLRISLAAASVILAASALASAQPAPDVTCKATETQAECFTRLKCKPNEELEACQKRLKAEAAAAGNNGGQQNNNGQQDHDRGQDRERQNDNRRGNDRDRDADHRDNGNRRERERERERDHDRDRDDRHEDSSPRHRRSSGGGGHTKGFQANKTFGAGLELGEPSGLNGKYFLSEAGALDFGLGWIYGNYYYGEGLHLYADYLYHPISLVSAEAFELPFYIGGGLRYWDFNYCDRGLCNYTGSAIGIRIPFGIAFDFNNVPLDIFIQFVPVIDFVRGDYYVRYGNREHFSVDFSIGIRYWFK